MADVKGTLKKVGRHVGKSLSSTLGCFVVGGVWGGVAGGFGSFAVPSSVRSELSKDNLDVTKEDLSGEGWPMYDRISNWSFHIGRGVVKYSLETAAMYKMVEDIANGGDLTWGLLAIPNAISTYCECRRYRKTKKASQ